MIDPATALSVLANAAQTGQGVAAVVGWLRGKVSSSTVPNDLQAALGYLPAGASGAEISAVVESFMRLEGGCVSVLAGHDGGGSVVVEGSLRAGDGVHKGGDLVFQAGSGGPNGNGGDVVIGPGAHRAGDATG
jgi:hypothetical protein